VFEKQRPASPPAVEAQERRMVKRPFGPEL